MVEPHVNFDLYEAYMDLSRDNLLGWVIADGIVEKPFPPPEYQIR